LGTRSSPQRLNTRHLDGKEVRLSKADRDRPRSSGIARGAWKIKKWHGDPLVFN
jgi:hypothetical protein